MLDVPSCLLLSDISTLVSNDRILGLAASCTLFVLLSFLENSYMIVCRNMSLRFRLAPQLACGNLNHLRASGILYPTRAGSE